jgi:hypothetical protein
MMRNNPEEGVYASDRSNMADKKQELPQDASQIKLSDLGNVSTGDTSIDTLLKILLLKEAREAKKQQDEYEATQRRTEQRAKNAQAHDEKILLKQARCKHLKGTKKSQKSQNKDYAVYSHTFINAVTVVQCHLCGMKWKNQDTAEYLFRNGRKISNHTKIGWVEAQAMLDQSTNTPSSSEVPMTGTPIANSGVVINSQTVESGALIPRTLDGEIAERVEL